MEKFWNFKNDNKNRSLLIALLVLGVLVVAVAVGSFLRDRRIESRAEQIQTIDRGRAYTDTGFLFRDEGRERESEGAFLRALELDPKGQTQAYLGLAELYRFYIPEKEDQIPSLFLSGLQYDPPNIILLRALAQYYERISDIPQARRWYGQIIEYYPGDIPAKQKIEQLR